ncbi:MAG TPA: M14 family zinc carboxypeptidase [Phycisphaerae bacterium]|nr:M14 family zinc carboxypeptidase [Phycisphaerae bacterium]HNU46016.1 M14 family zinc carboxypeptidase [Phycisphaerae bacterium]
MFRRVIAMVFMAAAVCAARAADGADQVPQRFDGYQVVTVAIPSWETLAEVEKVCETIMNDYPGPGKLDVMFAPGRLGELDRLGLSYVVKIEDYQVLIDNRDTPGARGWFDAYHRYSSPSITDDIVDYLEALATTHPNHELATMLNVGNSVENRTIWGLVIAGANVTPESPTVLYFGAEHAREWIAATVPTYVATYLMDQYGTNPVVTDLVDNVRWVMVPVMNPDGYEHCWTTYRLWRKNRRNNGGGVYGVDLNRNWGEGWGGEGSSSSPSSDTYRGPSAFSEPETVAIRNLFDTYNVRAMIDLHSYGLYIMWPYGYQSALPAHQATYLAHGQDMQQMVQAVHGVTYTIGPVYSTLYAASGVSVDWTYVQRGVLSYTIELRDTGAYGFELPANQIIPNNQEVLPAILYLANTDWVRLPIRFEFPNGLPEVLQAGSDTVVAVNIVAQYAAVVPGTPQMHYRYDPAGAFVAVPLTSLGGNAYQAVLPATNCLSTPEFYFSAEADTGVTVSSPRNAPAEVYDATMSTGANGFYVQDLSSNPGWTTQGLWAWGHPTGGGGQYGGPDPTNGYTGANVYGYNLSGDYTNSMPEYHLTSTAINCSGRNGVHLVFRRWLGVERSQYDHAYVRVSTNGTTWTTVWQNPNADTTDTSWQHIDLDISAVADNQPTVYLRWTMGTTDGGWTYCGWNIDDIRLTSAECEGLPADYNGDGNVDLPDYAAFSDCLTGPDGGVLPGCAIFELTGDADVDLDDLAAFQRLFTGP